MVFLFSKKNIDFLYPFSNFCLKALTNHNNTVEFCFVNILLFISLCFPIQCFKNILCCIKDIVAKKGSSKLVLPFLSLICCLLGNMNSCLQLTHKQAERNNKVVLLACIYEWLCRECQFFSIKDKVTKIPQRRKRVSKSKWVLLTLRVSYFPGNHRVSLSVGFPIRWRRPL